MFNKKRFIRVSLAIVFLWFGLLKLFGASPVGEIIGGSQREHDIEKVKARLVEQGEDPTEYEFYLDTRRYGSIPHGGFGLGVERVISWVCGLDNIKDAIPFPRTMERYKP